MKKYIGVYENKKLVALVLFNQNIFGKISTKIELFCEPRDKFSLKQIIKNNRLKNESKVHIYLYLQDIQKYFKNKKREVSTVISTLRTETKNFSMVRKRLIEQNNKELRRTIIKWVAKLLPLKH